MRCSFPSANPSCTLVETSTLCVVRVARCVCVHLFRALLIASASSRCLASLFLFSCAIKVKKRSVSSCCFAIVYSGICGSSRSLRVAIRCFRVLGLAHSFVLIYCSPNIAISPFLPLSSQQPSAFLHICKTTLRLSISSIWLKKKFIANSLFPL